MKKEFFDTIFEAVKLNFETHDQLMPVAFIGNDKTFGVVGGYFGDNSDKDAFAEAVKETAKEIHATFVLFVSESWIAPEAAQDFIDNRDKYPSVSDHPLRKEVVVFQYESHTGCKVGIGEIVRTATTKTLIKPTLRDVDGMQGRFTHLLPLKRVH